MSKLAIPLLESITLEPVCGRFGHMKCCAVLLQNMCLPFSPRWEGQQAGLHFHLLQKPAHVIRDPPPKFRREKMCSFGRIQRHIVVLDPDRPVSVRTWLTLHVEFDTMRLIRRRFWLEITRGRPGTAADR
ncbi:unnamed protein product [Heligmosomoides polygyrus]|uniref:Uncharacterized protein n=1 Tax=Heligmosomoides polygyrus TaxID=6339 RepID=A0A183FRQ1_HELPZ|nr:unnamed protein product [Heligmosomoides polygyrus]